MTKMTEFPSQGGEPRGLPLDRKQQIRLASLLVLGSVLVFSVVPFLWDHLTAKPRPVAPAPEDGTFRPTDKQWQTLRFETVHRQAFPNGVTTDGKIAVDDDRTTQVFSPFTGQVSRIFVKAGDVVRAGAPLFAVIANEAAQSDADMLSAGAALKAAAAEERRQRDLAEHQGAAQKDLEAAEVNLANARAAMTAADTRRKALGGTIGHGEGLVRAPGAGVVTQRLIGPGQNVVSASGGGATQAFTISDFSKVWVVGNLREEDADKARLGQPIRITLLADPGRALSGRLDYVAPMLDAASRRLTVRATLDNRDGTLKPEMYATVSLLTGGEQTVLSVPDSAVIYEGATARVWVAQPGTHRLALRPVVVGPDSNGRVEITGGLADGETVVTAGSLFIDRGARAD